MLGYRDSGMPDTEANARPEAFANAPLDEAVGRLVEIIRRERPQVIVTYGDDQEGYPHPDHLQVHDITHPGLRRAPAIPTGYPELGEPWTPSKLYYSVWSRARMLAIHEKFARARARVALRRGVVRAPVAGRPHHHPGRRSTGYEDVRFEALLAHATQVDPTSPFWFGLPREVSPRRSTRSTTTCWPRAGCRRDAARGRPLRRPALISDSSSVGRHASHG